VRPAGWGAAAYARAVRQRRKVTTTSSDGGATMVRLYAGLLLLTIAGCTTQWRLTGLSPNLPPKTVVEVWSHNTAVHWRGVIVSPDSIRGVPYPERITCNVCRRALARSDVDSFRVRKPSDAERGGWIVVYTFALIAAFAALIRWG
jgi:hypothetical protein